MNIVNTIYSVVFLIHILFAVFYPENVTLSHVCVLIALVGAAMVSTRAKGEG